MQQRRPKLIITLSAVSILAVILVLQALHTLDARRRALQAAEQRAANLSRVLAVYVQETFGLADASLRQLTVHARRVGGPHAPNADWDPILAAANASMAGTGSISVIDANGIITHSTQGGILGQSRHDTLIFREFSKSPVDRSLLEKPFRAQRPPYSYILPLGRPLTNADGTFAGAAVVTVLPDDFRTFFKSVDVGDRGAIWVFHPDGVVLFREPTEANPINAPAKENAIFRAATAGASDGIVSGPAETGGEPLITAYHRLTTPPAIVAVSFSRGEILANWTHQIRSALFSVGVLAVTLGFVMAALFRQIDARAGAERELSDLQRAESTRLREANERLAAALAGEQHARRETEQASYLKDEFLMTVSHELRTPLTAIFGWARVLASGVMPIDQQRRALEAVERNARAQAKLIDDLLDVSRAISGKLRIEARPIQVGDVLQAAVETLGLAMQAKSIHFETRIDPGIGIVSADPDRLQQIAWNLLSNAIKFTPEGGRVELEAQRLGQQIEIVVRDSGAGIAPDFLPHVFERFRQEDAGTRRRFGGLGLGLAIVRHLVELHGGTVSAESAGEGQGATFRVVLPVRAITTPMPESPAAPPVEIHAAAASPLDGTRILIVDDEPDARELFESILRTAGAHVVIAGSAAEAVKQATAHRPEVVVSDIEMPGEDGYQLLARLRGDPHAAHPPFLAVAVTAHAREADRQRAFEAGFQAHVTKPVDPPQLVQVIADLLRDRTPAPGSGVSSRS